LSILQHEFIIYALDHTPLRKSMLQFIEMILRVPMLLATLTWNV